MTEYFNVKTLTLNTPEQCLNYNKIVSDLIQQGHQILPYVPSPNRIEISYIQKVAERNDTNANIYNISSGNASIRFSN